MKIFLDRLAHWKAKYALTGSLAAQRLASVASPRLAQAYVTKDPTKIAAELELKSVDSGANVQLILPRDRSVLSTASEADDGLVYVRPVQAVLDLLTSPGRGPAEGEELLRWMQGREDAWLD